MDLENFSQEQILDNPQPVASNNALDEIQHDMVNFSDITQQTSNSTELPALELIEPEKPKSDGGLYGGRPFQEAISPDGIKQGHQFGDCFYLAALAGLANSEQGRAAINNMIRENSDGSFNVTFPKDPNSPVRVGQEDLDRYSRPDAAPWARVMEAAFMKYTLDSPVTGGILHQQGIPTLGRATRAREAIQLLTNTDSASDNLAGIVLGSGQLVFGATSRENVRRDLNDSLANGSIVTAGASGNFMRILGGHDSGPLPEMHAYTVLNFDQASDTVTVRNPWGSMIGTPLAEHGATVDGITHLGGGRLQMSFANFYERFSGVEFSHRDGVLNPLNHVGRTVGDGAGNAQQIAENLASGNVMGAMRSTGRLSQNAGDLAAETVQAVTSATWYPLIDHPEDLLLPPLTQWPLRAAQNPNVQRTVQGAVDAGTQAVGDVVNGVRQWLPGQSR